MAKVLGIVGDDPGMWDAPKGRAENFRGRSEGRMGSVVKKRRKKIRKHKYKKLRKSMRHRNK